MPPASHRHSTIRIATRAAMIATIAAGCAAPGDTLDEAELRSFAAEYTAAWNSLDPQRMAAHFSVEGTLTINDGPPAEGRTAIAEAARGFMSAFPDLHLTMDSLLVNGHSAMYHWTFVGTNSGPGGTGNPVRFSGYEEWTMGTDQLIARSLGHFDQADYDRQVRGAGSAPPAP